MAQKSIIQQSHRLENTLYVVKNPVDQVYFPSINPEKESHHVFFTGTNRSGKTTSALRVIAQAKNAIYFDPSRQMWSRQFQEMHLNKHWTRKLLGNTDSSLKNVKVNAQELDPMIIRVFSGRDTALGKARLSLKRFFRMEKKDRTYRNLRTIFKQTMGKYYDEFWEPFRILLSKQGNAPPLSSFMSGRWLMELCGSPDDYVYPLFLMTLMAWRIKNKGLLAKNPSQHLLLMGFDECGEWGKAKNPSSKGLVYVAQQGAKLGIMGFFISPIVKVNKDIRLQMKGVFIFQLSREDCLTLQKEWGIPIDSDYFDNMTEIGSLWKDYFCYYASNGLSLYRNGSALNRGEPQLMQIDSNYLEEIEMEENRSKIMGIKPLFDQKKFYNLVGVSH